MTNGASQPGNGLVISGWGVISPIGIGRAAFSEALGSGNSGVVSSEASGLSGPHAYERVGFVRDFDIARLLGKRKGTRVLDRTAAFALGACTLALRDCGLDAAESIPGGGVVLGTMNGSFSRVVEMLMETMTLEDPWRVSPEAFPNTVMNFAAGQCAIWHKLKAMNATLSGGKLSLIYALRHASRALRNGHADLVCAGSVEELCPYSLWALRNGGAARADAVFGEGAAMFVLESAERCREQGRRAIATAVALECRHVAPDCDARAALRALIDDTLAKVGLRNEAIWAVAPSSSWTEEVPEINAVRDVFGEEPAPLMVDINRQVGDCSSASGAMQAAALLGLMSREPSSRPRYGLMTSHSPAGNIGCAVFRAVD